MNANTERQNNFDVLRLVAAMMVLVSHCYPLFGRPDQEIGAALTGIDTGGGFGVAIFFFMSGFLVTGSLERSASLTRYAAARALRILPALAAVVLICAFVLGPAMTTLPLDAYWANGATWSYLGNIAIFGLQHQLPGVFETSPDHGVNGSLWTLPIEVAMYIVLAAFFFAGLIKARLAVFLAAGFFAAHVLSISVLHWSWNDRGPVIAAVPLYDFFKLGTWFFIGSAYWLHRDALPVDWRWALAALMLSLATVHSPYGAAVYFLTLPYLVYYVAYCPVPLHRLTRPIGDISYGVYLWAFPVQQTVFATLGATYSFGAMMGITVAVTCAAGYLSWHLLEKHALRLKPRRAAGGFALLTPSSARP